MLYVNCGCGAKYSTESEWVNLDFYGNDDVKKCNIIAGLPFSDSSVDAVFSSNMLEHFSKCECEKHLGECYRVLKVGGGGNKNCHSRLRRYLHRISFYAKNGKNR